MTTPLRGERLPIITVFLSVNDADALWAAWFKKMLRRRRGEAQFDVFFYKQDTRKLDNVFEGIIKAIKQSAHVLLLMSPEALDSSWCRFEWDTAMRHSLDLPHSMRDSCQVRVVVLRDVPEQAIPPHLLHAGYWRLCEAEDANEQFQELLTHLRALPFKFVSPESLLAQAKKEPKPRPKPKPRSRPVSSAASRTVPTKPEKVGILGAGYAGLSLAAALAAAGHPVVAVERNLEKRRWLASGHSHLWEPKLDSSIADAVARERFSAPATLDLSVVNLDLVVVCLGPNLDDDSLWNTAKLERMLQELGQAIACASRSKMVDVVIVGTLRPGDFRLALQVLADSSGTTLGVGFQVVLSPLFVREGSILDDLSSPPLIATGTLNGSPNGTSERWTELMLSLTAKKNRRSVPVRCMRAEEVALLKLASNAFHATKVAFANEVGRICTDLGFDAHRVMEAFVQDRTLNVSPRYLKPGFAFGGWCLEKDVLGLLSSGGSEVEPLRLLSSIVPSNQAHLDRAARIVLTIADARVPRRLGVLGVTFKAGSDDVRASPTVELLKRLPADFEVLVFDEDLERPNAFTGVNSEVWLLLQRVRNVTQHELEHVLAECQVIVLAKLDAVEPSTLKALLHDRHLVIDLVGARTVTEGLPPEQVVSLIRTT